MFIAGLAGLGTWLGRSVVLAFAQGYVRGMGGIGTVLLTYQPWKLIIRVGCWFGAAWAGLSVFDGMGGM